MATFREAIIDFCQSSNIAYTQSFGKITITSNGKKIDLFGSRSSLDSVYGCSICDDKLKSELFLKSNLVKTTDSKRLYTPYDAIAFYQKAKEKTVIKPKNGSRSRNVTVSVGSNAEAAIAWSRSQSLGGAIGQRFLEGKNYRVTVLNGEIMFAMERIGEAGLPVSVSTGAIRQELEFDESWPVMRCCLLLTKKLRMHTAGFDVIASNIDSSEFWILEMNQGPILFPDRATKFIKSFL